MNLSIYVEMRQCSYVSLSHLGHIVYAATPTIYVPFNICYSQYVFRETQYLFRRIIMLLPSLYLLGEAVSF